MAATPPTTFSDILERTTRVYTATIKDEDSEVIAASDLDTLTLTLYAQKSGTIINSRNDQDVLNANNVTVNSSGVLEWTMQPADNAIVNSALDVEAHIALFEWTYASGSKAGKHEVKFLVTNLQKVP